MNYGFIDDNPPELEPEDESDRLFIQLYHMNIRDVDLAGKQVLEVGSGRGGGASWIARTYAPTQLTGLDYSAAAVKLCNRMYGLQENLTYVEGNAMKLPFDDESFDVLYNVESSHCYSDMEGFINEAYRVLKPGGYFAWTDFRDEKTMNSIRKMFDKTKFEKLKDTDITQEVIQALDEISEQKEVQNRKGDGQNHSSQLRDLCRSERNTCLRGLCQRRHWSLSLFVAQIIKYCSRTNSVVVLAISAGAVSHIRSNNSRRPTVSST